MDKVEIGVEVVDKIVPCLSRRWLGIEREVNASLRCEMTDIYKQPILILRPYSVHLDLTRNEPALPTLLDKDNSTLGNRGVFQMFRELLL